MKYKHIIFDIDGTMLNSAYADLMALQKVIWEFQNKKHGNGSSEQEFLLLFNCLVINKLN